MAQSRARATVPDYNPYGSSQIPTNTSNSISRPSFNRPQSIDLRKSKYTQTTYNENYPWLNEKSFKKLESAVEQMWFSGEEKRTAMDQWYRNNVKYLLNDQTLEERAKEINEQAYQAAELKNPEADAQLRMTEFSQALKKKYNLDATADDLDVFNTFVSDLWEEWVNLAWQYLSWENKKLRYDAGLETWWEKAADFGVWVLQSPWKRGYNLFWQLFDRTGKWIWEWTANMLTDEQKEKVRDWLDKNTIFKKDRIDEYAQSLAQQEAEWNTFNGRENTDIRTPLLWEERANSTATKVWEVVGDIGTAVALTAPMWAATAPIMADSTLWGAALLWASEWAIDTAFTHLWSQWNLNVTPWEMALWTALGGLWWVLTNKLSQAWKEVIKNSDKVDDATRLSSKIADKTDDANRIAGRIWQWDIDDQAKVVEWVKSITKRSWEKWVKDIKKYGELKDAIKASEKQIISQEDDLLRQFPDKITDWTTTETVRWLGDQVDDVTRDYLDDWIELLKKYNKNDPVAMRELEMLQNTKNTEWLTRLEAKELARKLWAKLSKKFYNSNDELRNSMSAESYEQIRRWIQNAVRDRLPDDVLKNLDIEYSNLKAFEWLTDDMAEKVNTLTQKIKELWPIEKLWRKVWDAINRVTGKGIKWVVEKFLPSNMWNKINNSIDMEIELSKNLSKLVDLNKAIDALNTTMNSSASKSVINTALRNFADAIANIQIDINPIVTNTAVRWAEATANAMYNN